MNPSLRRLCILAGLVVVFGIGMTMAIDHAHKHPRALPTTQQKSPPLVEDATPQQKNQPSMPPAEPSALYKAGQTTREAVDAVRESGKHVAKDANVIVQDAAAQVGETAKQVGDATSKAAAEASRFIGEFANGLNAPTSDKKPIRDSNTTSEIPAPSP